ncbi:helix-turn-helix domain-containing protein [Streptomyces jumonjinensis]
MYRVRFTEPGVGKYLKRWGLTYQRPDKRAVEQGAEAVRVRRVSGWRQRRSRSGRRSSSADRRPAGVPGRGRASRPGRPAPR